MWDTCTSFFGPRIIDRFGRGGSKKVKIWPRMGLAFIYFWPWSLLEAPKWVKDPGNGLKSIRGSWRDHFGGILGPLKSDLGVFWAKIPLYPYNVKFSKSIFSKSANLPILSFWILNLHIIICQFQKRSTVKHFFSLTACSCHLWHREKKSWITQFWSVTSAIEETGICPFYRIYSHTSYLSFFYTGKTFGE